MIVEDTPGEIFGSKSNTLNFFYVFSSEQLWSRNSSAELLAHSRELTGATIGVKTLMSIETTIQNSFTYRNRKMFFPGKNQWVKSVSSGLQIGDNFWYFLKQKLEPIQ